MNIYSICLFIAFVLPPICLLITSLVRAFRGVFSEAEFKHERTMFAFPFFGLTLVWFFGRDDANWMEVAIAGSIFGSLYILVVLINEIFKKK